MGVRIPFRVIPNPIPWREGGVCGGGGLVSPSSSHSLSTINLEVHA